MHIAQTLPLIHISYTVYPLLLSFQFRPLICSSILSSPETYHHLQRTAGKVLEIPQRKQFVEMQEGPGVEGEVVRELRDIRDRVNKLLDLVADSGTNNSNGQQQEPKGAEVAFNIFLAATVSS